MEPESNNFSLFLNNRYIDIWFEDITYTVNHKKEKKPIIKGVSGKFVSGEMTAIMGPSGAGKTTLLNILTGLQTSNITGSIKCNTSNKNGSLQYKKESCYILQEDNLPNLFTVLEIMNIAASLKLSNITEKRKEFLINDILRHIGLKICKNTKCQDLSGGQRKRLSVALELIDNPPIMFLDEPTTGLDSSSTTQCVQMLKNLTRDGRTIICTIHQPSASIFEMFDHVYVMAQGHCVYQGSTENTVPYLASLGFDCPKYHNPADYLLEVVNGDYGNHTELLTSAAKDQKWRRTVTKVDANREKEEINAIYPVANNNENIYEPPSELTRFWILLSRCRVQLCRDWTISQLKLLLHILVGIFLGITFQNSGKDADKVHSNLGFMLCCVVYLCYTSLMPAVLKFPSELAILRKERFNNWYKLKTYFAAFLISDIPTQVVFGLGFTTTSYFISSQPVEWSRYLMVLSIQILVALSSSSLGLLLGTIVNPVNGTFWGAIILAMMLTCSGVLIMFTHMSKVMYLLTYLSFLSYAVEGHMQAIYGYNRSHLECPEYSLYCHYSSPETLLTDIGMNKQNFWIDFVYLFSVFVGLRYITFFTLRRKLAKT
ncbi:ATP-binding cassette sub-family G member 1 [Anoplophora glabripennis]|uniref:ATP-binding cassette sub-family G member 1 n=1 Tax=Anoplophora glabripennis TaxID=217634 RepID=UPI000873C82E|nr:ATP-binding cassette sub-family G member 1 [Anoplophora glabripennis]